MYPSHLLHTHCADNRDWYFLSSVENNGTEINSLKAYFNPPGRIRSKVIEVAKSIEKIFQLGEIILGSDSTCRSCKYNIDEEWGGAKCIPLNWDTFTIGNIGHGYIGGDDNGMNSVCPLYLKKEGNKKVPTGPKVHISDIGKFLNNSAIEQNFFINPMQVQQGLKVADNTLGVHIDHNGNGTMSVSFTDIDALKQHLYSLSFSWAQHPGKGYFRFIDLIIGDKKTRFIDTLNPPAHA